MCREFRSKGYCVYLHTDSSTKVNYGCIVFELFLSSVRRHFTRSTLIILLDARIESLGRNVCSLERYWSRFLREWNATPYTMFVENANSSNNKLRYQKHENNFTRNGLFYFRYKKIISSRSRKNSRIEILRRENKLRSIVPHTRGKFSLKIKSSWNVQIFLLRLEKKLNRSKC